MSINHQTNGSIAQSPNVATGAGSNPFASNANAAYAPAMAYAVVAKVMAKEMELARALKKVQSEETQSALKNALKQSQETKASGLSDGISRAVTGTISAVQGITGIAHEASSSKELSKLNEETKSHKTKLANLKSPEGVSQGPERKKYEEKKAQLESKIEDSNRAHKEHLSTKDSRAQAVSLFGQMGTQVSTASGSMAKSNKDAEVSIAQAQQQSYKEMAQEMSSSAQSAHSVARALEQTNFASATAIS